MTPSPMPTGWRFAQVSRTLSRLSAEVQCCPDVGLVAIEQLVGRLDGLVAALTADDVHGPDAA